MPAIRSRSEVEQILSDFSQSGQSRREFCSSRGIKPGTFQWWMRRYRDTASKRPKPGGFIRLTPKQTSPSQSACKESELTIDFQSGARLRWRGTEVPVSVLQLISSLNNGTGGER